MLLLLLVDRLAFPGEEVQEKHQGRVETTVGHFKNCVELVGPCPAQLSLGGVRSRRKLTVDTGTHATSSTIGQVWDT